MSQPEADYSATHPFWVAYLSVTIDNYLQGSQTKADLKAALRALLRSPVPGPELRRVLTKP